MDELPAGVAIHMHSAELGAERALQGVDSTDAMSGLGHRREESTHIEQLPLPPNKERAVTVRFCPESGAGAERHGLARRTFRLQLRCCDSAGAVVERRVVQCKALVCTSWVSVSDSDIDFGDCNVGTVYTRDVQACPRENPGHSNTLFFHMAK